MEGHSHITICICTYKRLQLLQRLLEELSRQNTGGLFSYSIVVTDNDAASSAKSIVERFHAGVSTEITYRVEPEQNIALARNRAVANARGDFIDCIDDDEFPEQDC